MMQAMLIVLGAYLAACYCYGMYLAVRLFTGRRLRHTALGTPPRRVIRPLKAATPGMPTGIEPRQAGQAPEQAQAA